MGKRAVQMSFELWSQMMTTGWQTDHIECIEGIPEDARLVDTFQTERAIQRGNIYVPVHDLVCVFEHESWSDISHGRTIQAPSGQVIYSIDITYRQDQDKGATLTYSDRGEKRQVRVQGLGHCRFSTNFEPEHPRISYDMFGFNDPLQYQDFEELV